METIGNAVVVGAGPAGCLMTHYLLQRGFEVQVFERHAPIQETISTERLYAPGDSRSYPLVITSRAIKAIEGAGLQLPPSLLKPLVGSCSHLTSGKKVRFDYSNNPNIQSYAITRNALVSFFQRSLLQRNYQSLSAHFGWELSELSTDKTRAFFCRSKRNKKFDNAGEGEKLEVQFDLLIGADGISSKVRSELMRLDTLHNQSAPMALDFVKHPASYKVFTINPQLARASPLFEDHDRTQSWPALNMLLVNVSDGSFWGGSQNEKLMKAQSPLEVERLFRDNAPDVFELLLKENLNFPEDFLKQPAISFGGAIMLSRFHDDNVVLIGDAAHAMFPSYGTGCNAALEDCLLFNNILAELTPSGGGKFPASIATAEFTKKRLADAHAIVEMNTNMMLFRKGFLGLLQARLLKTLQIWFPSLFGPTAHQLLWSDVPFSKIKQKRHLENALFYAILALFGSALILVSLLVLKRFLFVK